jgi:anti-sigma factor RsiW
MSLACADARALATLAHDDTLPRADSEALNQHLAGCAACRNFKVELERQSAGLRALGAPAMPETLPRRIEAALREAAVQHSRARWAWPAALAAALLAGVLLGRALPPGGDAAGWPEAATEVHLRALLAPDVAVIASADPHTLRPWFAGRLDFAPPVQDLAEAGFPLVAARLDYFAGRKVAVVQYARRAHRVALIVWPEAGPTAPPAAAREAGHALLRWREGGFARVLVSDVNAAELAELARLLGAP